MSPTDTTARELYERVTHDPLDWDHDVDRDDKALWISAARLAAFSFWCWLQRNGHGHTALSHEAVRRDLDAWTREMG